jgi:DNA-binding CsgD family transcriptional regulator
MLPAQRLSSFSLADQRESDLGFVLVDQRLRPVYTNSVAIHILKYGADPLEVGEWDVFVREKLRRILRSGHVATASVSPIMFSSGRRRYMCRSFVLSAGTLGTPAPLIGLLMERHVRTRNELQEASARFHLSPRERQTLAHLTHGLTTKEIAKCMNVSPNTVKQFVRLIMIKMNVTTRSGVVGKLLAS